MTVIMAPSSRRRRRVAVDIPPATPPTMTTLKLRGFTGSPSTSSFVSFSVPSGVVFTPTRCTQELRSSRSQLDRATIVPGRVQGPFMGAEASTSFLDQQPCEAAAGPRHPSPAVDNCLRPGRPPTPRFRRFSLGQAPSDPGWQRSRLCKWSPGSSRTTGCQDLAVLADNLESFRGRSSMAESQPSKLVMRVRFPSPAPRSQHVSAKTVAPGWTWCNYRATTSHRRQSPP